MIAEARLSEERSGSSAPCCGKSLASRRTNIAEWNIHALFTTLDNGASLTVLLLPKPHNGSRQS
jgi:hypothetical protein